MWSPSVEEYASPRRAAADTGLTDTADTLGDTELDIDHSCGCASTGGSSGLWLLGLPLLALRRRR